MYAILYFCGLFLIDIISFSRGGGQVPPDVQYYCRLPDTCRPQEPPRCHQQAGGRPQLLERNPKVYLQQICPSYTGGGINSGLSFSFYFNRDVPVKMHVCFVNKLGQIFFYFSSLHRYKFALIDVKYNIDCLAGNILKLYLKYNYMYMKGRNKHIHRCVH